MEERGLCDDLALYYKEIAEKNSCRRPQMIGTKATLS